MQIHPVLLKSASFSSVQLRWHFNSKHHNLHYADKSIWTHPIITDFRSFSQTNCRRCINMQAAKWVFLKSAAVARMPLWKDVTTVIRCFPAGYYSTADGHPEQKHNTQIQNRSSLRPFSGNWCRTPTPALSLLGTLLWFGGVITVRVRVCLQ